MVPFVRSRATTAVALSFLAQNGNTIDLWEIDVAALTSPTRLTNTTSAVTKNITLQEERPDYGPKDAQMVFRVRGKSGRDGGIFVASVSPNSTPTKLLGSAEVRDPAWRP